MSCPTFGGTNYEDIYVTTAGGEDPDKNGTFAGGLFKLKSSAKGKEEYRSKIEI